MVGVIIFSEAARYQLNVFNSAWYDDMKRGRGIDARQSPVELANHNDDAEIIEGISSVIISIWWLIFNEALFWRTIWKYDFWMARVIWRTG